MKDKLNELTSKLYTLIEVNVDDGFIRMQMYDIIDEIEELNQNQ